MNIVCYGCGRGMGENDVEATDEIRVWYGLHDFDGCGSGMGQMDAAMFDRHVRKQNELPRGQPASPSVAGAVAESYQTVVMLPSQSNRGTLMRRKL